MSDVICVIGATRLDALQLLDMLCEANPDDIHRRREDVGIMNDGSTLVAMSLSAQEGFWGRKFDYVFYEDGRLIQHCANYSGVMEYIEQRCLVRSVVPREFQWCAVNTMLI